MKLETLARRVAEKVGFPPLEEALLRGDASLIPEGAHLIWTGSKTQEGLRRKMIRDHYMRPEIIPVYLYPFARIKFNKKKHYVHRLVFDRVFGLPPEGRLKNVCGYTLCINPHHWLLRTQEFPEPPEISEDWSVEDAVEILDMYLDLHTTIDRNHNLLVDMPEEVLRNALVELNKEHLI